MKQYNNREYKAIDRTGERFGRWVILGDRQTRKTKKGYEVALWLCRCDCGTERYIQYSNLRWSHTPDLSCGCMRAEGLRKKMCKPPGFAATTQLMGSYRTSALKRGHEWALTREEFIELISLPCHYCGALSSQEVRKHHDYLKCNGIDRKNSDIGYIWDNCVPCCKYCNFGKNTQSLEEFYSWVKRLHAHLGATGQICQ